MKFIRSIFCLSLFIVTGFSSSISGYRENWVDFQKLPPDILKAHEELSEIIALSQRNCADKLSNTAAFSITLLNKELKEIGKAVLPYVVVSGEMKSTFSSSNVLLVKNIFSKCSGFSNPIDFELKFLELIAKINGTEGYFKGLDITIEKLRIAASKYISFSIPNLDTGEEEVDRQLRSLRHCEQTILIRSILDRTFLQDWISGIKKTDDTPMVIMLNIVTYNDMCQRCFSTSIRAHELLTKTINEELKKNRIISTDLPLQIAVSSFRPYTVEGEEPTRICSTCTANKKACTDYPVFIIHKPSKLFFYDFKIPVFQFFNQYIGKEVAKLEIQDAITSITKDKIILGEGIKTQLIAQIQKAKNYLETYYPTFKINLDSFMDKVQTTLVSLQQLYTLK